MVNEKTGGASEDRTRDLMIANHALSQLSYSPNAKSNPPCIGSFVNLNLRTKSHPKLQ
jgi:hypothetical protein